MSLSIRNYQILPLLMLAFAPVGVNAQASEGRALSQQEVDALGLDKGVGITREAAGNIADYIKASEADTREQKLERYLRAKEALERYRALVDQKEVEGSG